MATAQCGDGDDERRPESVVALTGPAIEIGEAARAGLTEACRMLAAALGAHISLIAGRRLDAMTIVTEFGERTGDTTRSEGWLAAAISSQHTMIVESSRPDTPAQPRMVVAPMRSEGELCGCLVVERADPFATHEITMIERAAADAGASVLSLPPTPLRGTTAGAEALFRASFELAGVPAMLSDLSGRIVDANAAAARLLGWSRDELRGLTVAILSPPATSVWDEQRMGDVIAGRIDSYTRDRTFLTKAGAVLTGSVTVSAVRDPGGAVVMVLAQIVDRTAETEARGRLERSEALFRAIVQRSSDVAVLTDATGVISDVSPAIEHVLGYTSGEVIGRSIFEFVHPDDLQMAREKFGEHAGQAGTHAPVEARIAHRDLGWRWVEDNVTNLLDDPDVRAVVINLRDVTPRHVALEALRRSEQLYRTLIENATEGVLVADREGRVMLINQRMSDITRYPEHHLRTMSAFDLVHPEYRAAFAEHLRLRGDGRSERYETVFVCGDGEVRTISIAASPLHDESGDVVASLGLCEDITERKQLELELERLATHDALTQLLNRAVFLDHVETALRRTDRVHDRIAVLFCDLDNFKAVNDELGHAAGDDALIAIAASLRDAVRPSDVVARLGGDEFGVLCEVSSVADAEEIADRIVTTVEHEAIHDGGHIVVRATVGIAVASGSRSTDAPTLLQQADLAMYEAKRRGGAGYAVARQVVGR